MQIAQMEEEAKAEQIMEEDSAEESGYDVERVAEPST